MKFLVLLLFTLLPVHAANVIGAKSYPDGSKITLLAPLGIFPSGGFFPVRVEMENKGLSEQSWSLSFSAIVNSGYHIGDNSSDRNEITSDFSMTCPPGLTRAVELLVPVHQRLDPWSAERGIQINIAKGEGDEFYEFFDGETSLDSHLAMSEGLFSRFEYDLELALIAGVTVRSLSSGSGLSARSSSSRRRSYYSSSNVFVGPVDLKKLPGDWRAYAGYDALILSREDYLGLEPGARSAIEKWISGGGHLVVLKDGEDVPLPGFEEECASQGFGFKSIIQCGQNYDDFQALDLRRVLARTVEPQTEQATRHYMTSLWNVGKELGTRSLGTTFILIALVIFAIIVGPINLFFWANKNHRQRLLWTTPLISLIASILLVGFIMLKDGFGGEGARAIAIDVGSPGDNTAAIIQEQFTRTGILLDSDFTFDKDTVLTPVPAPVTDFNRTGSLTSYGVFSAAIQPSDDGWSVEGDFFQSRTERAQILRSVVPSRERLELLPETRDAPQIVSSFSYPLTDIFYNGRDNQIWTASAIEPGSTVTMTRSTVEERAARLLPTVERFGEAHRKTLEALTYRPGSFSALAENAPSLETHTSIDWKKTPALITGRLIK